MTGKLGSFSDYLHLFPVLPKEIIPPRLHYLRSVKQLLFSKSYGQNCHFYFFTLEQWVCSPVLNLGATKTQPHTLTT